MTDNEHTPGPWKLDNRDSSFSIIASGLPKCTRFGVSGEWDVATVDADDDFIGLPQARANARLIAAAPELLEALEGLYNAIDCSTELTPSRLQDALAAIAKARGET